MTRPRLLGLLAVLALLAGSLYVGTRSPSAAEEPGLAAARAAAALPACLPGLTPDLPDVALPCLAGGPPVRVSAAPGRPLLVNVWATWCGPCVEEVPALVGFAGQAKGRVQVVGVVHEDSPDSVYAFARAYGINYPLLRDDLGQVLRHYGSGVPLTLLVAADGTVEHVQVKPFRSVRQVADAVAEHLGVRG